MRRNYRHIFSTVLVMLSGLLVFAQEAEYKDVVLDGKPAKLNLKTGEVTFVNPKDKKKPVKLNDVVVAKKKDSLQSTDSNSIVGLHVVQEGETLLDISKYYNVPISKLKLENNLESTLISKGQILEVKNFGTKVNNDTKMASGTNENLKSSDAGVQFHLVEKDETLFSLAKRYNLSLEELKGLNHLSSNFIAVGQKLRVRKSETIEAAPTSDSDSIWIVSKGDTLYSIAKKNGLTVSELKALNGLTNNTILIGQKLRVN